MLMSQQRQINNLLRNVAETLDIPDEVFAEAVRKYQHLGHWLEEQDAKQGRNEPSIYPQGSFRLGTVIRPITDADEYDIDLVYERDIRKASTSQEQLKKEAGDHLRGYIRHCRESHLEVPRLVEGRRCWKLDYPDSFHMDVLPALPDDEGRQKWSGQAETRILISDRELHEWQHSNPIGYAEWFKSRMAVQFQEKRAALAAEMAKASAEDVPKYKVKTPLQRAIQILKRHRDIHFQDDEDRPISIIITTLAAKSYDNQANLLDALLALVRDMPKHIEVRRTNGTNVSWVANPVDDDENFADKWEDNPQREVKFRSWLDKVNEDLDATLLSTDPNDIVDILGGSIGSTVTKNAAASTGLTKPQTSLTTSTTRTSVPAIGNTRHCQHPPWTRDIKFTATLKATVHRKEGEAKIFDLTDRPVPKNLHLRFELSTDATGPYEIHWQVVNTGADAIRAGGLRGGFDDNLKESGTVRWEHTEYAGTHWIEAFVVKHGYCVARSGRSFVRIPE